MKRYADVISGTTLALIGIVLLNESKNIRAMMEVDFGPRMIPRIYAVGLIILGAIIALRGLALARRTPVEGEQSPPTNRFKVGATMALIVFYVAALRPLGFLVTSIVYLFLQIVVLGGVDRKRRLLPYAIVSFSIPIGIYLLFYHAFLVFLPRGRIW